VFGMRLYSYETNQFLFTTVIKFSMLNSKTKFFVGPSQADRKQQITFLW
jgi:hypothetical protein